MKKGSFYILWVGIALLSGCNVIQEKAQVPRGHYYLTAPKKFDAVNRVLLLELDNQSDRLELSELLTHSLADGLSKKHLFAVRTVHRSDPLWTTLNLNEIKAYAYDDLSHIHEALNVDAVIFGTIKRYQSFPHLLMSLHLKMVDVRHRNLLWAIEQVWDSSDRQVELRMREYYRSRIRKGYEPLDWKILVTSPRAFNKFIVDEVGDTFPEYSDTDPQTSMSDQTEQFILGPVTIQYPLKVAKNP
jgi:hypothetical protein